MKIQRILENGGTQYKLVEDEFSHLCLLVPTEQGSSQYYCKALGILEEEDYRKKGFESIEYLFQRVRVNPGNCKKITWEEF
jgi:hypothetical protein